MKTLRILAIDDDPILLHILKKHFKNDLLELDPHGEIYSQYKFEFVGCHSGIEGISAFELALTEKNKFDLVFLDVHIPDTNGLFVLKELRQLEVLAQQKDASIENSTICMLTSDNTSETILEAFEDDCDGYLSKPIHIDKVHSFLLRQGLIV